MRLLQYGGESGIRTHEDLRPTAFRERHFRPLRHLSVGEYSIFVGGLASPLVPLVRGSQTVGALPAYIEHGSKRMLTLSCTCLLPPRSQKSSKQEYWLLCSPH